jgi:hypothetical protein
MGQEAVTNEEWEAVTQLLKLYARVRIDLIIMSGMLMLSQTSGQPPEDWYSDLKRLRDLPAHKASLDDLEARLDKVEQEQRENELLELLQALPGSDLVH